jgi:hypothetical protein
MWDSAKSLLSGVFGHYKLLIGGTLVGAVGFASDAAGFDVPPWVWAAFAGLFVGWAVLAAYHDLRLSCDAAMDGLRDRTDHKKLADALTHHHHFGTHELLNRVALNGSAPSHEWEKGVLDWTDRVIQTMKEHKCSLQEMNRVVTINQVDMDRFRYLNEISMLIIRLERIADVSTHHAKIADELTLATRKDQTLPPAV